MDALHKDVMGSRTQKNREVNLFMQSWEGVLITRVFNHPQVINKPEGSCQGFPTLHQTLYSSEDK